MSLSNRLGLLGRKVGMMRIFTDDGDAVPVTVLDVSNNRVTQIKTVQIDGYSAIQVAFGRRKASRVTKPEAGHLAKAGAEAGEVLKEFRVPEEVANSLAPGAQIAVTGVFSVGQNVDVQGTSIGKGFTGSFRALAAGEVPQYTNVVNAAREQAVERLMAHAKALGADAVLGVRFDSSDVGNGLSEILAYGTAVKVSKRT